MCPESTSPNGTPVLAHRGHDYPGLPAIAAGEAGSRIRALRAARDRLCAAAAAAAEGELELALDAFVTAAWEAGFLRATAYSVVAVVLESELPRRGSRARRRATVDRWVRRARELYDARAGV
jgi:hypothetical protein